MKQKGFTLVEILVVMAVGGMLMSGVLLSVYQITWGSSRNTSQVIALTDVNQAALAIKKDLWMAQATSLTPGDPVPQNSVTLTWTDYTGFAEEDERNHSSVYTLSGTNLLRTRDGVVNAVGRNITAIGFTQDSANNVVRVTITATSPEVIPRSETLSFSVQMRTEETE